MSQKITKKEERTKQTTSQKSIKVEVIYGNKRLIDCMRDVLKAHGGNLA